MVNVQLWHRIPQNQRQRYLQLRTRESDDQHSPSIQNWWFRSHQVRLRHETRQQRRQTSHCLKLNLISDLRHPKLRDLLERRYMRESRPSLENKIYFNLRTTCQTTLRCHAVRQSSDSFLSKQQQVARAVRRSQWRRDNEMDEEIIRKYQPTVRLDQSQKFYQNLLLQFLSPRQHASSYNLPWSRQMHR